MKQRDIIKKVFMIAGPLLMAAAVNLIYEPSDMVTGGISGLAIIVHAVTSPYVEGGINIGLFNMTVNIILFIIGFKILGRNYIKNMVVSTIVFSIALFVIPLPEDMYEDYFLSAIFGGILNGLGLGMVFLSGSSTGGSELISAMIQKYMKGISITSILMVIEAIVVLLGLYVFGPTSTFYSIVAIVITMKIADSVMSGFNYSKMVYVISKRGEEISEEVMDKLQRGVTGMKTRGMYTGSEQTMLLCIIRPRELVRFMEIVSRIDRDAFVIIGDAREVMGEGFMENGQ